MRLYLEHRRYFIQCQIAEKAVKRIVDEREEILSRVEPKSSLSNHEREFMKSNPPTSGQYTNKVEEYVIELEQKKIKERLAEAKEILAERKDLLTQKEAELRKSKDIYNVIYTLKWVDGVKADAIVRKTGYSRSQVYNIIDQIKRSL